MSKVLVTGGAGYIGQIICQDLENVGYDVVILDNLLYGILPNSESTLITGDICNIDDVNRAMRGVDHVIHLAAIANDPATDLDPRLSLSTNFEAIKILKKSASKNKISRFIFSSSCSVYGDRHFKPSNEHSQVSPITLYGKLKVDAEIELLNNTTEFHPIILRNATAFGYSRRLRLDLAINLLTFKGLKEGNFVIFGGNQWRPFVHVKDISSAFIKALEAPLDLVSGNIFNVGSNSLNYQMKEISAIMKKELPKSHGFIDIEKVDKRSYKVDFRKIKERLGFTAKHTINFGIRELINAVENGEFEDWKENTCYYCVKHLKKYINTFYPQFSDKDIYPSLNMNNKK